MSGTRYFTNLIKFFVWHRATKMERSPSSIWWKLWHSNMPLILCILIDSSFWFVGAQWLSGRVLDSRRRGRGLEPHGRHCVVSLSKNINPSLVLVQPRKTPPFITERLLMGHKESNQTKNLLVWYNKLGIVHSLHCTYLGMSGYHFQKNLVFFCLMIFLPLHTV